MNRVGFAFGIGFGFLIAAAGVSDYDVIHRMLLLQELDVFWLMASAIAVAMPLLWLLERRRWSTPFGGFLDIKRYRVTRKDVLGAAVFGSGWAIAGTCPAPALTMVAGGGVLGLVVIAGIFAGILLRDAVVARQAMLDVTAPQGDIDPAPAILAR